MPFPDVREFGGANSARIGAFQRQPGLEALKLPQQPGWGRDTGPVEYLGELLLFHVEHRTTPCHMFHVKQPGRTRAVSSVAGEYYSDSSLGGASEAITTDRRGSSPSE